MNKEISWRSLVDAYILLFVYYPSFVVYHLVSGPFLFWWHVIVDTAFPWFRDVAQETLDLMSDTMFWPIYLRLPTFVHRLLRWSGLLPASLKTYHSSTAYAAALRSRKHSDTMYDFMEGYVLLVPDWSPVDAAPIDFRLKDITRLLQQPNAKPKNGAGRESPTSRPSTPLQKKAKGHKHSASAVSQSGLSMSDRKGLLSRAQLAYIVLDGPEGWLRFYTDSSKSEAHAQVRKLNLRDMEVDLCSPEGQSVRCFHRGFPIRISPIILPSTKSKSHESLELAAYHFLVPTSLEKEYWYFALVKGSRRSHADLFTDSSTQEHVRSMVQLINTLHLASWPSKKKEDDSRLLNPKLNKPLPTPELSRKKKKEGRRTPEPTLIRTPSYAKNLILDPVGVEARWLNLLLGRVWLSAHAMQHVHNLITDRVLKKISKIKRPAIMGEISVRNLHVGKAVPFIEKARIMEFTDHGELLMQFDMQYRGGFKVDIETEARLDMPAMSVKVVVEVEVEEISGTVVVRSNPLPSCRFWWGFLEPPHMVVKMRPLVADKNLGFNLVKDVIEKRLHRVVKDSLVCPNMDDIVIPGCDSANPFGIAQPKPEGKETSVIDTVPVSPLSKRAQTEVSPTRLNFAWGTTSPPAAGSSSIPTLFGPVITSPLSNITSPTSTFNMFPQNQSQLSSLIGVSIAQSMTPSAAPSATKPTEKQPFVSNPITPQILRKAVQEGKRNAWSGLSKPSYSSHNPFTDIDLE